MIAVALIALNADSGDPNPKGTMALIFGVIAVFVVILFVLQRSDLEKVAGGDAKAVQRAVAEGGGKIENPTTMEEQQLWAALAVKPIDNEAIKARGAMWDSGRDAGVQGEIARRQGAPRRRGAGPACHCPARHAQLDPLEETGGRGRPGGHRRRPQGRRAGRLALRPLARRAPARRLTGIYQKVRS